MEKTSCGECVSINYSSLLLTMKRAIDILIASLALSVVSPVLLLVSLLVKKSSTGSVFYRGLRAGLDGNDFKIIKFRTMVENAENLGGPTTGSNDPRVTKVGGFLRKTKLDELPQLINVLVGDMSIVGPRPEVLEYTSQYTGEEKLILQMRPGITDYSSIEFADLDDRVGDSDPDLFFREHILPRKNKLRVYYVKNWSLSTDFLIILKTLNRVLKRVFFS